MNMIIIYFIVFSGWKIKDNFEFIFFLNYVSLEVYEFL